MTGSMEVPEKTFWWEERVLTPFMVKMTMISSLATRTKTYSGEGLVMIRSLVVMAQTSFMGNKAMT